MNTRYRWPAFIPVWVGVFVAILAALSARAQTMDVVAFANLNLLQGINAPFYDETGTNRLSGDRYRAALYVGPGGAGAEAMRAIGVSQPFRTGSGAGYWVSADIPVTLFFPTDTPFDAQVRFWDTEEGQHLTFDAARAAGAAVGVSIILRLSPPPPPLSQKIPLTGLQSAGLIPVKATLSIRRSSENTVAVSWPATGNGPWLLESTDTLETGGTGGIWQAETNSLVVSEGRVSVTVEALGSARVFRLRRDP